MDQHQIFKQMIDFNKATFDTHVSNAMRMVQEQTERMVSTTLDQAPWLPKEGKKAIEDWIGAYKSGSDDFKKSVDDNFKKVEDFFASTKK